MANGYVMIDGIMFAKMLCGECGVVHLFPKQLDDHHKKEGAKGKGWTCPNGHSRIYRESDADAIRRERDRLKQELAYKDDRIRQERELRESAERSASAARGQVTKLKNRAAAGVCPCCTRSFTNLRRHIETKHPTFKAEVAA